MSEEPIRQRQGVVGVVATPPCAAGPNQVPGICGPLERALMVHGQGSVQAVAVKPLPRLFTKKFTIVQLQQDGVEGARRRRVAVSIREVSRFEGGEPPSVLGFPGALLRLLLLPSLLR